MRRESHGGIDICLRRITDGVAVPPYNKDGTENMSLGVNFNSFKRLGRASTKVLLVGIPTSIRASSQNRNAKKVTLGLITPNAIVTHP